MSQTTPKQQAIRKQRVVMTVGSYICTGLVLTAAWLMDYLTLGYLALFALVTVVINGAFYLIFHWNLNRHFRDPDLTLWQMLLCLPPHFYIMIFMTSNAGRHAVLFVSIIPLLYGILGLDTRRFAIAALVNIGGYLLALLIVARINPGLIVWQAELVVVTGLAVGMIQLPLIGGYISQLRRKLKHKNGALKEALEKISEIAHKDELTGICNRRSVVAQVTEEYERCMRGMKTFSVILFDLDFFKSVNDKFGHLIGDSVLRRTALACQEGLRANDCLGRYGGEEFLLILPNTELDGARFKAEQLRQKIDELDFSDLAPQLKVTISIGVAAFSGHESYWDTIERADQALYQAKHDGRNRVSCLP